MQQGQGHIVGIRMSSRSAATRSMAEIFPEWDRPRTTLGAPIKMDRPASRAAEAASSVVGNSAMTTPSRRRSSTWASVASSWLASARPSSWEAGDQWRRLSFE